MVNETDTSKSKNNLWEKKNYEKDKAKNIYSFSIKNYYRLKIL